VSVSDEIDQKSFKKLKNNDNFFIKIHFFKDGILKNVPKGKKTAAQSSAEESDPDGAAGKEGIDK